MTAWRVLGYREQEGSWANQSLAQMHTPHKSHLERALEAAGGRTPGSVGSDFV